MPRLFVAFRPPASERDRLLDAMDGIDDARWQDDDQLHLTLRFIGDADARMTDDIVLALARVATPAFPVRLAGSGLFAGGRRGGAAVWTGAEPRAALTALHQSIDRALVLAGLPPEHRAYRPHVTLARLRRAGPQAEAWVAAHSALAGTPFRLDHFELFESTLTPAGAAYDAIARFDLPTPPR